MSGGIALTPLLLPVAVLAGFLAALPLEAQQRWPVSLELTLGRGYGRTADNGHYVSAGHRSYSGDAVLAVRLGPAAGGRLVVAGGFGGQGGGEYKLICYQRPDGSCRPQFPDFALVSLMAGLEAADGSARGLVGPVYDVDGGGGVLGRADIGVGVTGRLSLVGALRGAVIFRGGDAFRLLAVGAGVRIR